VRHNVIESIDHVLRSLGFSGDLDGMKPRSNPAVYFHRNELRRFVIDELRNADAPVSARDLAEKIIGLEVRTRGSHPEAARGGRERGAEW
jgi:hypothetical protein